MVLVLEHSAQLCDVDLWKWHHLLFPFWLLDYFCDYFSCYWTHICDDELGLEVSVVVGVFSAIVWCWFMEVTTVVSILVVRRFLLIIFVVIGHMSMMMVWRSVVLTIVLVYMFPIDLGWLQMFLHCWCERVFQRVGCFSWLLQIILLYLNLRWMEEVGKVGNDLFSLMQVLISFTLIWRGFWMFSSQLVISSPTPVGHILVMNSHMVLLNCIMVTLLLPVLASSTGSNISNASPFTSILLLVMRLAGVAFRIFSNYLLQMSSSCKEPLSK